MKLHRAYSHSLVVLVILATLFVSIPPAHAAPRTPGVITNDQVSLSPSGTSATITWTTPGYATSRVDYHTFGSNTPYTTETGLSGTDHKVVLNHLKPNQEYAYIPISFDSRSNIYYSRNHNFFTTPPAPPLQQSITDLRVNFLIADITLTWSTPAATTSIVQFNNAKIQGQLTDSNPKQSHSQTLTAVTPGETYTFKVVSRACRPTIN